MTFRAGHALSAGLHAWGRNVLPAVGISALCWAPIATLLPGAVDLLDVRGAGFAFFCFMGIAVYAPVLVAFLLSSQGHDAVWIWVGLGLFAQLLQFVAMGAVARRIAGAADTWAGALTGALTRIVSLGGLLAGAIVLLIFVSFGFLLVLGTAIANPLLFVLVLPALLAFGVIPCRYWVALPVMVIEKQTFWTAVTRSAQLTTGSRARVFGIVAVLYAVPAAVIVLTRQARPVGREETIVLTSILFVAGIVLGSLRAVVATHTYLALLRVRGGLAADQLSKVFD